MEVPGLKKILVVDDEPKIIQLTQDYLENAGFSVLSAGNGERALSVIHADQPDLVVLDLGLPGMDGLDICRSIRKTSNLPIIMLTARDEEADKIVGLELGADDYVTKPFSPKELVARVRSVLRRSELAQEAREVVRVGDVTLDIPRMRVTVGDDEIELTATEFHLLQALASQPGRIFTRSQLLNAVHGVAIESYERAIDAHIKNIRRKIEPVSHEPRYIQTVYGVGYRFSDEA
jgi:DNA-binding response OmpR family regulator